MKKKVKVSNQSIDEAIYELRTLRDMLRWGFSQLNKSGLYYGHGTTNAWDESIFLVLQALHLDPLLNKQFLEARLTSGERNTIAQIIAKRINKRIPAPYLTNEAWFAGLPFYVDQRVLIPRSPLAELITQQFTPWVKPEAIRTILDLCTGSGCIAIACSHLFPEAMIDATDISHKALEVAKINIDKHQVNHRVHLKQSDLFCMLSNKKYDLIISNPPYVSLSEQASLPIEYQYEPSVGLIAGKEGLDLIIRILQTSNQYLNSEGVLIVEVGNSAEALIQRYPDVPFTWLTFQHGDVEIFLLTKEQLEHYFLLD